MTTRAFPQQAPLHRPTRWQLARSTPDQAIFEGQESGTTARLIYRRERADRLYASLERREDGRTRMYPWHYQAAPLEASGLVATAAEDA